MITYRPAGTGLSGRHRIGFFVPIDFGTGRSRDGINDVPSRLVPTRTGLPESSILPGNIFFVSGIYNSGNGILVKRLFGTGPDGIRDGIKICPVPYRLFVPIEISGRDGMTKSRLVPSHRISQLLENITNCDLQILHDGSEISNHNIPTKVVWFPEYSNITLDYRFLATINSLESRFVQTEKLVFILANVFLRSHSDYSRFNLNYWISTAITHHTYHVDYSDERPTKRRFFQYGKNVFVVLISMMTSKELKNVLPFFKFPEISYTFIVVVSYLNDKANQLCAVTQLVIGNRVYQADCLQIPEWDKRIPIIANWPGKWCLVTPLSTVNVEKQYFMSAKVLNPFNRSDIYTMGEWVQTVLSAVNVSISHSFYCTLREPMLEFNYKNNQVDFMSNYGELSIGNFVYITPVILIITRSNGFQYFTCYREQYTTFKIYITPFQPELWITLIFTVSFLVVVISVYKHYAGISFSCWLLVVATIFEEAGHVPDKMEKKTYFRLSFGAWCLMSVILTNCYNGLMISELNAPLPSWEPKTFQNLICSKMSMNTTDKMLDPAWIQGVNLSEPTSSAIDRVASYIFLILPYNSYSQKQSNPYITKNCFQLYSYPINVYRDIFDAFPEFVGFLLRVLHFDHRVDWVKSTYFRNLYNLVVNLIQPTHSHYTDNFNFTAFANNLTELQLVTEKEIIKCGKSVLIALSDDIEADYEFHKKSYPRRRFYKGKKNMPTFFSGEAIRSEGPSKLPVYYKALVETGLRGRVEDEVVARKYVRRKPVGTEEVKVIDEYEPLGLSGAFSTFFVLWGVAVLISFPVFMAEIREGKIKSVEVFNMTGLVIEISSSFYLIPIYYPWSKGSSPISCKWSRTHHFTFLASLLFDAVHVVLFLTWFIYIQANREKIPLWGIVSLAYFMATIAIIGSLKWLIYQRIDEIITLLNQVFQLETFSRAQFKLHVRSRVTAVVTIMIASTAIPPVVMVMLPWWYEYMPPFVSIRKMIWNGTWLDEGTSSGWILNFAVKLSVALLEGFTWMGAVNLGSFGGLTLFIYAPVVVELWIQVMERRLSHSAIIFNPEEYRIAQTMQNINTISAQKPLTSLTMGGTMMAEITLTYTLISSFKRLPTFVAVFFVVVVFDFFVCLHILAYSISRPYVASLKYVANVRQRQTKLDKWLVRFLKSCIPLKFPLGDGNFFDKTTGLVITDVCVAQVVTLLLM
ncbi:hypothetical protein Fcan01_23943 [Folsomia candida]|uniref:Uncharacterized protein n=1 Tax=Folsomia candida TaxID=158441 RepID=A0A226D8Z0_FOLCA|nr:hypothetical protein Fcan01_23943 [Folsomia candida]